ncbi:glycoside hydrolase family 1 protein [Heliocybe sulcata]|uniref:Glycoside hydrolase family 1 protein n=1 Tax=Heliocybe sulcata TaxID=5364 RepID=A0A5C3MYT7_9AGAM|nr:glycoside hydrolase family 1 protein [Heliocybe sulcata]
MLIVLFSATVTLVNGATTSVPVPPPPAPAPSTGASFPPVGSVARDYSTSGWDNLWNLVGPVQSPPITTIVDPVLPDVLPSPPPALYPSWYAPQPADIFPNMTLPSGFLFGVSTAAYQVEGAVKEDGKGPTSWDWATRQPGGTTDGTTADITDLQYYLYKLDVVRMAALGINTHSFSISWARIYPFGAADSPVNQAGLDHYSDLIDYHLEMGVKPVATLFHWDTPLALVAYYGGFLGPQIVDDFVNYAKTVFAAYKGRVTTWYTFNEPRVFCSQIAGYPFNASLPTGVNSTMAPFICSYYVVKAHVAAVKAFREMGMPGEIAYKNDDFVGPPWRANSTDDIEAVERHAAFQIGVFSDPVYTTGDWPPIMTETLPPSFLPRFTPEEIAENKGTADFYAIDDYRDQWLAAPLDGLAACVNNMSHPLWPQCNQLMQYDSNAGWSVGPNADPDSVSWLQSTPQNFRYSLQQIQDRWPTNKIYISEFGFDEAYEANRTELYLITEDVTRTNYFMTYLGEALLSIYEDGIPLMGTFAWSIVDNAEWNYGFSARFGIQYVNHTTLTRTPKRSAFALSQFFAAHLSKNATILP